MQQNNTTQKKNNNANAKNCVRDIIQVEIFVKYI